MGASFHFFTDPAKLKPQSAAGAFGPLAAAQGKDRFRVTHRHETVAAGAPAIAVCDGVLCAQTESSGALTLILKPSQTPPFEAPVVSYFIYKGVAPASLLSGDAVLDETHADANDLTKRVAATWKEQNAGALAGSKVGLGLDRDAAFLHIANDPASKIFTDADPVERLFSYSHRKFQLPLVRAGDWIGSFGAACGLEIVLLRLGYRPKLGFARRADNVIEVPSLPATNGGAPWQPDDFDFFTHWHAKEQALAHMDPAAYFGAFVQAKIYKSDGADADRVKGKDVYDEILATFANRNVAWLDIRNNYGYSYDLLGLYGETIRFVSPAAPGQVASLDFRASGWPLLKLRIDDVPGSTRRSLRRTSVQLPRGLSSEPVIFVSKGLVRDLGRITPKARTPTVAPDAAQAGFLTAFAIGFLAAKEGGQDVLSASYARLNLYERLDPDQPALAPLDVARSQYVDGLFRMLDLRLRPEAGGPARRQEIFPEELFVDLEDVRGPTCVVGVGAADDGTWFTLFAYPTHVFGGESDTLHARPGWAAENISAVTFLDHLVARSGGAELAKVIVHPGSQSSAIDLLQLRAAATGSQGAFADGIALQETCCVVFDRQRYETWIAQTEADTVLDHGLPAFVTVAATQRTQDPAKAIPYLVMTLRLSGFRKSGTKAVPAHAAATCEVYGHAHP